MTDTWRSELLEQLEFYWDVHLRPRLGGLSDDEYFWEPVDGSWSVRQSDSGRYELEQFSPEPPVPPVTTIAWRAVHIGRDIFGTRARAFFGPTEAPDDADMYDKRHWPEPLPASGPEAIAFLERAYALWHDGVAGLSDDDLREPLGPKGAGFAEFSMAQLVLHINREVMAHGAEICLLRDLYRAYRDQEDPLLAACLRGDRDTAEQLIAGGDGRASGPADHPDLVARVAGLRRWDVMRLLVQRGFGVNGGAPSAPHSATAAGALEGTGRPPSALHYATAAGALEEVRYLVDQGADVGALDARFGLPPAGWADYFGHAETAAYLRSRM